MVADNPRKAPSDGEKLAKGALIRTKLALPMHVSCLVSRPNLIARLGQVAEGNVTLIAAPAGFGKTMLVTEWASRQKERTAWLALDEADNDPLRFWSYVVAALRSAGVELGDELDEWFAADSHAAGEEFISLILNPVSNSDVPVTLVLDDYHLVHTNTIHYHLGYFLRQQPAQMRVIILTRADPPLALARLRVQGRLLELRASDLRFSPAEVADFFDCALPYRLPQRAIQTLIERIEGWPAGLRLAALSLQERPAAEAQGFVQMFSGAERYVFHYLLEEVLQRQPPRMQTFLLQSSILRTLHPELCTAVTGYEDARQILDQMAHDNLFIVRLDGVADWYRYHRLFAGALRNRLDQIEPDLIPELRRRASDWHQSQGLREGVPERMLPAVMTGRYQFELDDDVLPIDPLTEREAEILALIAEGLSNQQIAEQLVISVGTVKGHINHLLSKLDAHSRTDALAKARRLGLLKT